MKLLFKTTQKGFTPLAPFRNTFLTGLEVQPMRRLDDIFSANSPAAQSGGDKQSVVKLLTGFTLVELLVVLSVLGLLIVGSLAVLSDAKARARDSRRVGDIMVLHQALAMYLNNHDYYLVVTVAPPGAAISGSDTLSLALKNDGIVQADLVDPLSGQDVGGETFNYYYYTDADGKTYTLTYCLETTSVSGKQKGCNNSETF